MRPVTATVGPLAAGSATAIATSQTPGAAGALTLNGALVSGGVAVMDNPRRVLITTADTTTVFTINGLSPTGTALSESFKVAGGSTYSTLDYAKVTSITVNQGTTAAVTVGTNGIASTPWVRCDDWADAAIDIWCAATGTVNYTVQWTGDDPNSPTNPVIPSAVQWLNSNDPQAVGATTTISTNNLFAPKYVRVVLNSGTGSVALTVTQYNVANR